MIRTREQEVRTPLVPIVCLVLSAGFIVWSYSYSPTSRLVPLIVGYATFILCLLDLASRFGGSFAGYLRVLLGADFRQLEMQHSPSLSRELTQAGWMVLCVVGMLFIGILPTVPLYVLLSMRLNGRRPWREAVIAALVAGSFTFIVFELLLSYRLYRGVLFDERGFDAW